MTADREGTAARLEQALRLVIDPELGENVVDLGLIYSIAVENGVAQVEMTTTTRGCPAAAFLKEAVQSAAWAVPGIHHADVKMTYEPQWSPSMMSEAAQRSLGRL
jgi:metal-sulfur cluster biosynthetic enzyme